tara:strand:+ start:265 stop:606 length:342 start_codon:yes stop_codon:yes gene_type:complete
MKKIQSSQFLNIIFFLAFIAVIYHIIHQTNTTKESYQNMIVYGLFPEQIEKPMLDDIYKNPKRNRFENPSVADLSNFNVPISPPPEKDNKRVNYYNYTNFLNSRLDGNMHSTY